MTEDREEQMDAVCMGAIPWSHAQCYSSEDLHTMGQVVTPASLLLMSDGQDLAQSLDTYHAFILALCLEYCTVVSISRLI